MWTKALTQRETPAPWGAAVPPTLLHICSSLLGTESGLL